MLRDLRRDQKDGSSPRGEEYASNWLASAANGFKRQIVDLAKQKAELNSLEENAEKATLTRTEEVLIYSLRGHIKRLTHTGCCSK